MRTANTSTGKFVEHNMGEPLHSSIQAWLVYLLYAMAQRLGLQVRVELRIRVSASRFRIPDISVWRKGRGDPKAHSGDSAVLGD